MAANSTFIFLEHTPIAHALGKIENIDPTPIMHAGLVSMLLVGIAIAINRSYGKDRRVLPHKKTFSITNLTELAVSGLLNFMKSLMGDEARRFVPLIGTTAVFILFSNLMGVVPGFDSPTANPNTTIACALVIFFTTHFVGIKTHGVKYIKHFLGPVWLLAPFMIIIELIGHFARILSLSIRLFGNMFGDHMVLAMFIGLVPLLIPVIFMGLGVFVSLIQAFIFSLLSIIYIAGALEDAHCSGNMNE